MDSTRRDFLKKAAAGGAALGLGGLLSGTQPRAMANLFPPGGKKLNILILGGTRFLGPHTVQAALDRGHKMTLFNRGKSGPDMFPGCKQLIGDRYEDMSALKNGEWDAVIDTFAYVPHVIEETIKILKGNVGQYVLISSVSAYKDYKKVGLDETYPVATISDEEIAKAKTHRDITGENYGALKALCEQKAEEMMPGQVANIRPGLIVGPLDPSDRFTYWPVRVDRGGEVLCPVSPKELTQIIHAGDLGEFIIKCIEDKTNGIFNAISKPIEMGKVLQACKRVSKSDAKFTWVDLEFLNEHEVAGWSELPAWAPAEGDHLAFSQVSVEKAFSAGLKMRPLEQTVKETLEWFKKEPAERQAQLRAGIDPEKEKKVLAAWHLHLKEKETAAES